jgi:hypothetical protein
MGTAAKLLDLDAAKHIGGELESSSQSLVQRFGVVVITNKATLEQAVIDRQSITAAVRNVKDFFEPLKRMAHELHATICRRERAILAPLETLDENCVTAIRDYNTASARAREAAERELAEQQRLDEQARATAEAAALETAGQPELAASVIAEAIERPFPVVALPDETKQVEGLSFRRSWHWRFSGGPNDVKHTPPAVLARSMTIIPREFLTLDTAKVGQYARAMKSAGKIPGIEIYHSDDPIR